MLLELCDESLDWAMRYLQITIRTMTVEME
jgi:hypothetical protein